MKTLPFIIFGIAALAQWAAPLAQIWTHEQTLAKGTLIKLKCRAPDPYDPLRGRFLAVRPEQEQVKISQEVKFTRGQIAYATLYEETDGTHRISSLTPTAPAEGTFVKLKVTYSTPAGEEAWIEWPFERFYINEQLAPEADEWFAENIRGTKGIIAEVRVLNGRAVLADLTLDGRPFREILKERVK